METAVKPSTIMLIAGGAVLFISTFLDWREFRGSSVNGWETELWGLLGIFVALIGLAVAVGAGLTAFANVKLPDQVLGFTLNQIYVSLGEAAFLITFAQQFASDWGIGILLGWIGAAVIVAGGIMEAQADTGGGSAPPTQF